MDEEQEYEYRPMRRVVDGEGQWVEAAKGRWDQLFTARGAGRPYLTPQGAKGVLTRQKRDDAWEAERCKRWHPESTPTTYEYKIQRRPYGEWEDFE